MNRHRSSAALGVLLLGLGALPVAGQEAAERVTAPGRVSGRGGSATAAPPDSTGYVVGYVRDDSTGMPVAGAAVSLPELGRRTLTDVSGRFAFQSVRPGTHRLRVRHIRYGTREVKISVEAGERIGVELAFAPRAIALEPMEVSVQGLNPDLVGTGFYRRMLSGRRGFFADEEFVNGAAWSHRPVREGLSQISEVFLNMMGENRCIGPILLNGRPFEPGHVKDYFRDLAGIEVYAAGDIPPDLLRTLEAYRKTTRELPRHPAAGDGDDVYRMRMRIKRCGIILLWTDRDGKVFGEEDGEGESSSGQGGG